MMMKKAPVIARITMGMKKIQVISQIAAVQMKQVEKM